MSIVYIVWHENREDKIKIYFRRSSDLGVSWGPEQQLIHGPAGSAHPSIAADGSNVYVVYGDHRHGRDEVEIYLTISYDHGNTWSKEKRLTDLPHASWVPAVAAGDNNVYLAWIDTRDGNEELYFKTSYDKGETWSEDIRLTYDKENSWAPSIITDGNAVHIVWFDQRDNAPP